MPVVTVFPRREIEALRVDSAKGLEGWPNVELTEALETEYPYDAHFCPAVVPGAASQPRLRKSSKVPVEFSVIVLDIDCLDKGVERPSRDWYRKQLAIVNREYPESARYETKHGYRLVWALAKPLQRLEYLSLLATLRMHASERGIIADTLNDWTRFYRLPRVPRYRGFGAQLAFGPLPPLGPLEGGPAPAPEAEAEAEALAMVAGAKPKAPLPPSSAPVTASRNVYLTQRAGKLFNAGVRGDALLCALQGLNTKHCKPPLPEEELAHILESAQGWEANSPDITLPTVPTIYVTEGEFARQCSEAEKALIDNPGIVYRRANALVYVAEDQIATVHAQPLRRILDTLADWRRYRVSAKGEVTTPKVAPPLDVAVAMRDAPADGIQPLNGILDAPTLTIDGRILDTPGYDAPTGLYLRASIPRLPKALGKTLREAILARRILQTLLADFPFETPYHLATAVSAFITSVCRHAIDGPVPLHVFDSTTAGSGKSLLADLAAVIATGRLAPKIAPTSDEELEKRITALVVSGAQIACVDNVDRVLGGAAFDAALTADVWAGRILGKTEIVAMPMRVTWFASGNNIRISGDLVRRAVRCYLVPDCEHPEYREGFAIPDIRGFAKAGRAKLLWACLTIPYAYMVEGGGCISATPVGSFEKWSAVVRDAMVWAGFADCAETQKGLRAAADTAYEPLCNVLNALEAIYGSKPFTSRDILGLLAFAGSQNADIQALQAGFLELLGGKVDPRSVTAILRRYLGRIVDGRRIVQPPRDSVRNTHKSLGYRVETLGS